MLHVTKCLAGGQSLAAVLLRRAATVELDWDVRQKSRFDCTDSQGRTLGVFLPRGMAVRGGDVLVAQDGSLVRVIAAPQPVLVIRHCAEHGTPFDLTRAAYHLGNRHVPIELKPDHLKIEPDHVLADMLRAMHMIVNEAIEAFEPEGGAYASHGGQGHTHAHSHSHSHHSQSHLPSDPDSAGHVHPHPAPQEHTQDDHEHSDVGPEPGPEHGHGHGHAHHRH